MNKPAILYSEYLKAKKLVNEYQDQVGASVLNINDIKPNQKLKLESARWYNTIECWVSEMHGQDVLVRTTEKEEDPMYDDLLVNISELRPLDAVGDNARPQGTKTKQIITI